MLSLSAIASLMTSIKFLRTPGPQAFFLQPNEGTTVPRA
jgi:hypothetical protein